MSYITREVEEAVKIMAESFKIVLITGPRQVGKSTMLKELCGDDYAYVTLDDINNLQSAQNDPKLFFINHPGRLIIDEIQYCPELFVELKRIVDEKDETGQFILTGSQTFSLMKNVSESLEGRVGIMELKPLSTREILKQKKILRLSHLLSCFNHLCRISRTVNLGKSITAVLCRSCTKAPK